MKNRTIKKLAAAVMAVALVGGALPTGSASLFENPSIAMAEEEIIDTYDHVNDPDHLDNYDPAVFDEKTGILTLRGKVNKNDVKQYNNIKEYDVKKVVCEEGAVFPENCYGFFGGAVAEEIDFTNANTSYVTDMSYMFDGSNLKNLDLSMLNTSKVTSMKGMFMGSALTSINLKNFDTSNVTNMYGMFWCCDNLASVDVSDFNTSKVETMEFMFGDCTNLISLDLSGFDTSNVKNMKQMFYNCDNIETIDVSSFNTSNVETMYYMFGNCYKLTSVDLTGFDTSKTDEQTGTYCMFSQCRELDPDIVHIAGISVTLDGSLGLNFYIYEPKYINPTASDNLAKIVMSGPNGDIVIEDVSVAKQSGGKYKFTYPLNATQAKEKVTLKTYDKNGKQLILCNNKNPNYFYSLCSFSQAESSLNNYFADVKETYEYKNDPVTTIMVNTLENYCKAAENYFKNTENIVSMVSDEFAVILNDYAPTFGEDIKISLVLDSENAIRIYTSGSDVKIDGQPAVPYKSKYGKCYQIANIPAHKLTQNHTLTVDSKEYKFSPMSYVYRVLNSESSGKQLKEAAFAVYMYGIAANEYIKK